MRQVTLSWLVLFISWPRAVLKLAFLPLFINFVSNFLFRFSFSLWDLEKKINVAENYREKRECFVPKNEIAKTELNHYLFLLINNQTYTESFEAFDTKSEQ